MTIIALLAIIAFIFAILAFFPVKRAIEIAVLILAFIALFPVLQGLL